MTQNRPMSKKTERGIPVVILVGGQGTRMQGETTTKKELVEVGGRPILWHVMKIFAAFGHTHFILTLGHQADALKRYFLEFEPMSRDFTLRLGDTGEIEYHQSNQEEDWDVTLVDTGLLTEKASRIYRVAQYLDGDRFFVTYADGVSDIDLRALLSFHLNHGRLATLTGARARWQYGIVHADENGLVSGFEQKPQMEYWINGGFMLFERAALDYMAGGDYVHLERQVLPALSADDQLMLYRHTGFWRSMDTFKEAQVLDELWRREKPWKVW
jgi:glucose-1-phosphate cytidylyltransferase